MSNNITLEEVYEKSFDFIKQFILDNIETLKINICEEARKELNIFLLTYYPNFFIEKFNIDVNSNNKHINSINVDLSIVNGI